MQNHDRLLHEDNRLLSGAAVRDRIIAEVADRVAKASRKHPLGKLVSISIGGRPEIDVYVRNQASGALKAGIPFDQQLWPADLSQEECKARLLEMNDDPDVLGVPDQAPWDRVLVSAEANGRCRSTYTSGRCNRRSIR